MRKLTKDGKRIKEYKVGKGEYIGMIEPAKKKKKEKETFGLEWF